MELVLAAGQLTRRMELTGHPQPAVYEGKMVIAYLKDRTLPKGEAEQRRVTRRAAQYRFEPGRNLLLRRLRNGREALCHPQRRKLL